MSHSSFKGSKGKVGGAMQETENTPQVSRAHNLWYFGEQWAAMFGFAPDHPGESLLQGETWFLS